LAGQNSCHCLSRRHPHSLLLCLQPLLVNAARSWQLPGDLNDARGGIA
jgi:hypothetical protein